MDIFFQQNKISLGDALDFYSGWSEPTAIISDGPYGVSGYEGDLKNSSHLKDFYIPHIKKWSEFATPQTTLWFWNTELGWANVHGSLEDNGWIFKSCNIWDKGIAHIAGNCNGKTMKKFPVVTEVCVQYIRKETFKLKEGKEQSIQEWMRQEWQRTGLTLNHANIACNVKNAASRKYLTKDHLWYFPPTKEFSKLVEYANKFGNQENKPYFSLDGKSSVSSNQWEKLRAKFNFEYGVTNVWSEPAMNNAKRFKVDKIYHPSEKPKKLLERIINASTDKGDTIWEPFAGSASASYLAMELKRNFNSAEINSKYFKIIKERFKDYI